MSLTADLRYALRLLARSPIFTVTSVLSLAAGVAASAAIFSLAEVLLAATWAPARRAASMDPMRALRSE